MFIQTRVPLAAAYLLNDCVLKKMWGPGPDGPIVDPPLGSMPKYWRISTTTGERTAGGDHGYAAVWRPIPD